MQDSDHDHLLAGSRGDDDVEVSSELPTKEMIEKAADIPIFDAEGKSIPFENLYRPSNPFEKKRVMVIFVRHFFCGVS